MERWCNAFSTNLDATADDALESDVVSNFHHVPLFTVYLGYNVNKS